MNNTPSETPVTQKQETPHLTLSEYASIILLIEDKIDFHTKVRSRAQSELGRGVAGQEIERWSLIKEKLKKGAIYVKCN